MPSYHDIPRPTNYDFFVNTDDAYILHTYSSEIETEEQDKFYNTSQEDIWTNIIKPT